jgi:hypothetical protein
MKIWIDTKSELVALKSRIERDGDELVHERSKADVVIPTSFMIPKEVLPSFGFECSTAEPNYTVSRWWNGQSWMPQLIVGVPLLRLMNNGLGLRVPVGYAARFVPTFSREEDFENPTLQSFLQESKFQGFCTFAYVQESVCEVHTGLPYGLTYNLLESVRGKLGEWFLRPGRLLESWTCSLLVSRPCFPFQRNSLVQHSVYYDLSQSTYEDQTVEGHVHMFPNNSTQVAFVTAWSRSLHDSSERVLNVCRCLKVPDKQYRTDLERVARAVWSEITEREFV